MAPRRIRPVTTLNQVVTAAAPNTPDGPSPLRRPGSIRRTASFDTDWPAGRGEPQRMRARARDLFTPVDGGPAVVLAEDSLEVTASPLREILALSACREEAAAQGLIGKRGGGHLRSEIATRFPAEHADATPLHLLLDDYSGASLVAGWAWTRWTPDWRERMVADARARPGGGRMEGICAGFRPGSSALFADGVHNPASQSNAPVPPLPHPDDPLGWHEFTAQDGVGFRRARRMDLWLDGVIHLDVGFQDSAAGPGGRIGLHEYRLSATADPVSFNVISIKVEPRILPYPECPAASANAERLAGVSLSDFRLEVIERLPGTVGCTHLNDVLRSLEDAPALARALAAAN